MQIYISRFSTKIHYYVAIFSDEFSNRSVIVTLLVGSVHPNISKIGFWGALLTKVHLSSLQAPPL